MEVLSILHSGLPLFAFRLERCSFSLISQQLHCYFSLILCPPMVRNEIPEKSLLGRETATLPGTAVPLPSQPHLGPSCLFSHILSCFEGFATSLSLSTSLWIKFLQTSFGLGKKTCSTFFPLCDLKMELRISTTLNYESPPKESISI